MPQHDRAVLGAGSDVAVGRDVALGSRQARYDPVVSENDLHNLGCKYGKQKSFNAVAKRSCF